jgi:hypothetical protein
MSLVGISLQKRKICPWWLYQPAAPTVPNLYKAMLARRLANSTQATNSTG